MVAFPPIGVYRPAGKKLYSPRQRPCFEGEYVKSLNNQQSPTLYYASQPVMKDNPMPQNSPNPLDNLSVVIFTDGSCLGNPGPGGWAAKLSFNGAVKHLSGGFAKTTNNRMELFSVISALSALTRFCEVDLYTDSRYVRDAVEKGWLRSWQKKNWKKADGKPVLNKDLWEQLVPLLAAHKVKLHWVEGHAGHPDNEEVDDLAREAASQPNLPPDVGFGQ